MTCPLHNWVISLETGKALGADEGRVRTIPLRGRGRRGFSSRSKRLAQTSRLRQDAARRAAPVRTTCPYCGVGCGVLAEVAADGAVADRGRSRSSRQFRPPLLQGLGARRNARRSTDRLLHPEVDGARASWDDGARSRRPALSGDDRRAWPRLASPSTSPASCLTEDYYVANKLMKGFIGSANIDTNSRLCMASSVAGHRRAFGSDTVPGVLRGSGAGGSRRARRLQSRLVPSGPLPAADGGEGEAAGTKIVADRSAPHDDGRHRRPASGHRARTATSRCSPACSRHLAQDRPRRSRLCRGAHTAASMEALPRRPIRHDLDALPRATGLAAGRSLHRSIDLFAATEKVVTVYSQGVNQSSSGTDKVNAIINCHLATGRIGRPGMGPFSVTGQPNAMGGREVGGLANMLAAHMEIEDADAPRSRAALLALRRRSPTKPGLKAVDLFRAVGDGRIKALWIMATNPVDHPCRTPTRVEAAIARLSLRRRLRRHARRPTRPRSRMCCCPRAAWGEKDGTVTNSERRISRQRAFLGGAGRSAARLVDDLRGRAPHGLRRGLRLRMSRRRSSPNMRALSAVRE